MKTTVLAILALAILPSAWSFAQERPDRDVDTTVTKTGEAAGTNDTAKDEAVADALRKAVEETCGVFIKGKTKTEDFQTVYDKVIAHTAGYVLDYKVLDVKQTGDTTKVKVRARVSTVKFAEDWARIAHTINQEGNPRVMVVIAEATNWENGKPSYQTDGNGTVQSRVQDFLLKKGLQLVDKETAAGVSRRDLALAVIKDDAEKIAAIGAKFNAEVIIVGTASAKFGKSIKIGDSDGKLYQYTTTLNVRAIQTDSARILMSNSYPMTSNQAQRNAEDKALSKLADDAAPKVLADVLEAWRKRANVSKTIELTISGMDRKTWKTFQAEASKIKGMQNLRLRDITEGVATIDVEYKFDINTLADRLEELTEVKLNMGDQSANRLSAKVVK
jgi:hypothetical protein